MKNPIARSLIWITFFLLTGCNGFEKGEGDMLYKIHHDQSGPAIREGELVELSAIEKTEEDSVIRNSEDDDRTALITVGRPIFKGDLFTALAALSKGDSATVKLNMDSMVSKMGFQKPTNTKGKYIIYTIVIHNVIPKGSLTDSQYKQVTDPFLKERILQLKSAEQRKIAKYIAAKKLKTTIQPSGLQYTMITNTTGAGTNPGDTVDVRYTGTFLSGKAFDATTTKPREIITGFNNIIPGLEESFRLFPAGTKATVIIPSALAFGEAGYKGIQSYTPLIYQLEIVRIRRLSGKRPTEKGASIPNFALVNVSNNILIMKEDLPTRKSVFILFSPDCDHCQHLVQSIGKQYTKFKDVNLYFASQANMPEIQEFMQRYGTVLSDKPNVTVLQDIDRRSVAAFQAGSYPSIYVYTAQHTLLKYFTGQIAISEVIKTINAH